MYVLNICAKQLSLTVIKNVILTVSVVLFFTATLLNIYVCRFHNSFTIVITNDLCIYPLKHFPGGAEIASTGKRKYRKRKYLYILVCRDDNTTVICNNKISSVSRLIVKPDCSRYGTSTHGTMRTGGNECVDTLLTKSCMSTRQQGNFATRRIKADVTRC